MTHPVRNGRPIHVIFRRQLFRVKKFRRQASRRRRSDGLLCSCSSTLSGTLTLKRGVNATERRSVSVGTVCVVRATVCVVRASGGAADADTF